MQITADEIVNDRSLIGHIIIDGLAKSPAVLEAVARDRVAEVILTVNGTEIDLRSFMNYWQSQVDRMIREQAMSLVEDKFGDVHAKMQEFVNALDAGIRHD